LSSFETLVDGQQINQRNEMKLNESTINRISHPKWPTTNQKREKMTLSGIRRKKPMGERGGRRDAKVIKGGGGAAPARQLRHVLERQWQW
jgi:hypothetical protein